MIVQGASGAYAYASGAGCGGSIPLGRTIRKIGTFSWRESAIFFLSRSHNTSFLRLTLANNFIWVPGAEDLMP